MGAEIILVSFFDIRQGKHNIMKIKTKEAGDLIDFQCTKCKILTIHTIVAMVAGKVARVKCNTCRGEHNYRAPKEEKVPTIRRSPATKVGLHSALGLKKSPALCYQEQWRTAIAKLDETMAATYEMEGRYLKDMLIKHPSFGIGVVKSLSYGKMEVFFNAGPKWLSCR